MASGNENRVLVRRGAREVTASELEQVNGAGFVHTNVCSAILATSTITGPGDGDACGDTD